MSRDTLNLVVGIITILVIIGLIVLWVRRSNKTTRSQYWAGVVSEKRVSTSTDDDGNVSHTSHIFITQDGIPKPKNITVDRVSYENFAVGDVIEKRLGELKPAKV